MDFNDIVNIFNIEIMVIFVNIFMEVVILNKFFMFWYVIFV